MKTSKIKSKNNILFSITDYSPFTSAGHSSGIEYTNGMLIKLGIIHITSGLRLYSIASSNKNGTAEL